MPQKVKIKKLIQKIITTIALAAIIAAIGSMYNNNAYAQTDNSGSGSTDNSGSSGTTSTDNSGSGSGQLQLIIVAVRQIMHRPATTNQQLNLQQIKVSNQIRVVLDVILL